MCQYGPQDRERPPSNRAGRPSRRGEARNLDNSILFSSMTARVRCRVSIVRTQAVLVRDRNRLLVLIRFRSLIDLGNSLEKDMLPTLDVSPSCITSIQYNRYNTTTLATAQGSWLRPQSLLFPSWPCRPLLIHPRRGSPCPRRARWTPSVASFAVSSVRRAGED